MRSYLVGETITFEAEAKTDGYLETDHSYSWLIDGSSYATNPKTYAFTAEGAYTSVVTATNTVTGGTAQAQVTINVVEPANLNWQALAALPPQSIESPIVASLNDGKALIICGTKSWEFDGTTWTPVGDLTYPRYGKTYWTPGAAPKSVTAADGRVWVFGNTNLGDVPNAKTIEIYDPSSKTWSLSASVLPDPYGGHIAWYDDVTPVYIGGCAYVGVIGARGCSIARYQVDPTATAIADGLPTAAFDAPGNTLAPIFKLSDTKIATMCGTTFHVYTLDVTASATPTWSGPYNIYPSGHSFNRGISAIADGSGGVYIVTDGHILHNALDGTASVQLDSENIGGAYLYYLMHIRKIGNSLFMVGQVPFWNGLSFTSAYGSTFFDLSSNTWSKTRCKKFTTTSPSGVYDKFYTGCGLLYGKPIVVGTYPATEAPWPAVQFLDIKVSDD